MRIRSWATLAATAATLLLGGASAHAATFSNIVVTTDNIGEPGIEIAHDGTIYIDGPAGLPLPSPVYRSTDGGATWVNTPQGLRGVLIGGGDSDLAIDPSDGSLYMSDLWLGSDTVSVSHDKGQTWLANPFQDVPIQDRQWTATPGHGTVYQSTHQIPLGLVVSKSQGGLVFPISTIAATPLDQTGCICGSGPVLAEGGGGLLGLSDKVGLPYATSTGGVKFARSTNSGLTFTNETIQGATSSDTTKAFPVVANAGGNHLAAVWLDVGTADSTIRFATSSDWGATWTAPKTLVSAGANVYPWVDARGSKVSISLYHTDTGGTPDTVPASAVWYEDYLESQDGGTTFSALQPADPNPIKTGPICTAGAGCTANRELLDFQSLQLDPNGAADLAYDRVTSPGHAEVLFAHQTG